jgi:two-component system NtrC family sensor kinase
MHHDLPREHATKSAGKPVRVLVIDDSPASQSYIVSVLQRLPGLEVSVATSGSQGVRAIAAGGISLVLCDYEMPDLSGLQVLHFARKSHSAIALPVLMLTSREEAEIKVRAFRAGANDYISKQAQPEELLARVGTQLELLQLSRAVADARESKAEQQKFEVIGLLAEGMAHELNTPAQYIQDNLGFLAEGVSSLTAAIAQLRQLPGLDAAAVDAVLDRVDYAYLAEQLPQAIGSGQQGIEQVTRVVAVLREFVRPGADKPSRSCVNEIVRGAIAVTRGQWHQVAELELQLHEGMPLIDCVPVAIKQVVLFALMNAVRSLATRAAQAERGRLQVRTLVDPVGWVVIEVRDNGSGAEGAQGLAHAHLVVVEQHRGRLEIDSTAVGTLLRMSLPMREAE